MPNKMLRDLEAGGYTLDTQDKDYLKAFAVAPFILAILYVLVCGVLLAFGN